MQPMPTIFVLIVLAVLLHIFGDQLGGAKLAPLRLCIVVVILIYLLYIVWTILPVR